MLAQTRTNLVEDPRKILTCIHGIAGVGKTSFCEQIPGHYFFVTEYGIEGVQVFGEPIPDWKTFLDKGQELLYGKETNWEGQREVQVIIIDTLEVLYQLCAAEICRTVKFPTSGNAMALFDRIDNVPYGRGYQATNQLLLSKLNRLLLGGFGVWLISHTKEKDVKWRGQEISRAGINLAPSAATAIVDACGAVGYFLVDETQTKNDRGEVVVVENGRWMYWQPAFAYTAKHRAENFPAVLRLPIHQGYETYLNAFQQTIDAIKERKAKIPNYMDT